VSQFSDIHTATGGSLDMLYTLFGVSKTFTDTENSQSQALVVRILDRPDNDRESKSIRKFACKVADVTLANRSSGGPERGDTIADADGTWTVISTAQWRQTSGEFVFEAELAILND